ncbi:MAG: corrinoid protein [Ignavibacteriaceae bacterium]|nr:corrinoid protein [Chitinophagales bacterium]MCC6256629.1 corrinoid protein [Ignavibacteriaceae bacterium]HRN27886.1 corrinoid protein [Ignavibacteriaceae bacterium]HRP94448.1 corrinoid protein [Ignavibacteriaceae bacterium]HRQ55631.1 corrinoid protein [Ignavibacteriaceae bacterium]
MNQILQQLSLCIEKGRVNKESNYPPDMKGLSGAVELTQQALDDGISAKDVLNNGFLPGMKIVGERFRDGKIFLPEVLISAKAMSSAMELLKPFFQSGEIKFKGKVIMGTVAGDLHDIGKNIVKMVLEGGGWQVIDLGVNVNADKFIEAIKINSVKIVGLSALLTTTMQNMGEIIKRIKEIYPDTSVIIGGAPVTQSFADLINADGYFADPQGMLEFLNLKFV